MNIEIKPDYAMDSAVDQKDIVVIDSGTDSLKIGFSGSDWPQVKVEIYNFNHLACFAIDCGNTNY